MGRLSDISAAWQKHGPDVLDRMAVDEPGRFAELCVKLVPKDVQVSLQANVAALDPADMPVLIELLKAAKQALPDIGERKPGEAMELMLAALRAHTAPLVTNSATNGKFGD